MSKSQPQPISKFDYITTHIDKIIHQLYLEAKNDAVQAQQAEARDAIVVSVLLISDTPIIELISKNLNREQLPVKLTTMTIEQFQDADFDQRYTLGCFIDPAGLNSISPTANNQLPLEEDTSTANTDRYNSIATKLRDLFAEQSLLLTCLPQSYLNLSGLGYIPLTIETHDELPTLFSWQFNLYDYKQRPDWLNAKYWANPENFDKYRW